MEGAIVFVFVLENLPGFEMTLNKTLQSTFAGTKETYPELHSLPTLHHCRTAPEPILAALNKVMSSSVHSGVPETSIFKDMSQDTDKLYDLGTVFDNSLPDYDEGSLQMPENNMEGDHYFYSVINTERLKERTVALNNESNVSLPKSPPFVAAIFESLSNVTAQTCAGAMVSKNWVLTAASCINLLGELYGGNMTDPQSTSHYTIVINSTNPLIDGTTHNVTTILMNPVDKPPHLLETLYDSHNPSDPFSKALNPHQSSLNISTSIKDAVHQQKPEPFKSFKTPSDHTNKSRDPANILSELRRVLSDIRHKQSDPLYQEEQPNLALMLIEPAVEGMDEVVLDGAGVGGEVGVYGWMLDKSSSEHSMHSCFLPAQTSPCQDTVNTGLCLSMTNETADRISELSSGGPVLTVHNDKVTLIGVAQTGERAINVYPVASHHTWIQDVLNSKWT